MYPSFPLLCVFRESRTGRNESAALMSGSCHAGGGSTARRQGGVQTKRPCPSPGWAAHAADSQIPAALPVETLLHKQLVFLSSPSSGPCEGVGRAFWDADPDPHHCRGARPWAWLFLEGGGEGNTAKSPSGKSGQLRGHTGATTLRLKNSAQGSALVAARARVCGLMCSQQQIRDPLF